MKLLAALVLAAAVPTTALAQPTKGPDVETMATDDCAKARKVGKTCVLKIEDETIEGGTPTHGGVDGSFITFGDHNSLIKIRRDFIREILRTAEDIE
ncbi:MAG: hypothetical protein JNL83_04480 [Myxococcales bacterium]|nr:hypothetical protein [Myxococcales bacterium]